MPVPVVVPRMGLTMTEGTVMRWLKREGDAVSKGEPILELMTDKVTMEVEAPVTGTLSKILHGEDAVVPVGEPLAFVSSPQETTQSTDADPATSATAPAAIKLPKATPVARRMAAEHQIELQSVQGSGEGGSITKQDIEALLASPRAPARANSSGPAKPGSDEPVRASPAARRAARELGIELAGIAGTGPEGRITEDDVRQSAQLKSGPELPAPTAEARSAVELPGPSAGVPVTLAMPVRGIRQVIAERMTMSFQTTPHFYLTAELDASALLDLHNRLKAKTREAEPQVTVTDLLAKLVATALAELPFANAQWKDRAIEFFGQVNIGVATATDQGLVVPVIKGVNLLPVRAIASARQELVARARAGKLSLTDISDGTFTLSNLGMYGVDLFSGIINPPQSALLAVGRIKERPYAVNGTLHVRPTMYVTLSVDHRVMDGAQGAVLLQRIGELIEQPALLVI